MKEAPLRDRLGEALVRENNLRAALEELKHELIIHGYAPERFYIELINAALNEETK